MLDTLDSLLISSNFNAVIANRHVFVGAFTIIREGIARRKFGQTLHKNDIHGVGGIIADTKMLKSQTENETLDFIKPIKRRKSAEKGIHSTEKADIYAIFVLNALVHSRGPCMRRQCQGRPYSSRDSRRRNLDIDTDLKKAVCRLLLRHLRESRSLLRFSTDASRRQGRLHSLQFAQILKLVLPLL